MARYPMKKTLSEKECLHIYSLMGIDVPDEDRFDTYEDYAECIHDMCLQIVAWVLEKSDDENIVQIAWNEHSLEERREIDGKIREYLKKKGAI